MTQFSIQQQFNISFNYPVIFERDIFALDNLTLQNLIDNRSESPKILPVIDDAILEKTPHLADKIAHYLSHHQLEALPCIAIVGGEASKHDDHAVQTIYQAVEKYAIDRHSYILVIGGGAVVDAIGYAAATAHRGIRLIRMPSTVLGQNDAGVGVKNAINYHGRKNYLGTFAPPFAVINDLDLLDTLSVRDKRAGIAEAVKVALIKDAEFFAELLTDKNRLAEFEPNAMQNMIIKGAKWHLNHIATSGDPFELGSARPLDFGHWSAHKLEQLSDHDLRHGEAVAIGIALDSIYSQLAGHLSNDECSQILELLATLGFNLNHPVLTKLNIQQSLNEFKEHLGGRLCITLLSGIGKGFEVNEIDITLMETALEQLKAIK